MDCIFLHFISKDPLTDAKALSGLGLNTLMLMKGFENGVPFNLLQRFGETLHFIRRLPDLLMFFLLEVKREVLGRNDLSPAKDDRPFDEVLQFSDISGIRVAKEQGSGLFGDIGN